MAMEWLNGLQDITLAIYEWEGKGGRSQSSYTRHYLMLYEHGVLVGCVLGD
jgi:hypothetical protein